MKKLLAIFLAATICFSMVACSTEKRIAELDRNEYEVIEVTPDNWQDYFEIVEVPAWEYDEAGEILDCYGIITCLCLKEEYLDKTLSEKTELEFKYSVLRHLCYFTADLETKELTFEAPDAKYDEESSRTATYTAPSKRKEAEQALYEYTREYPVFTPLLFSATGYATYRLENVNFHTIEGALVFEK